jgi:hypothetical protein
MGKLCLVFQRIAHSSECLSALCLALLYLFPVDRKYIYSVGLLVMFCADTPRHIPSSLLCAAIAGLSIDAMRYHQSVSPTCLVSPCLLVGKYCEQNFENCWNIAVIAIWKFCSRLPSANFQNSQTFLSPVAIRVGEEHSKVWQLKSQYRENKY